MNNSFEFNCFHCSFTFVIEYGHSREAAKFETCLVRAVGMATAGHGSRFQLWVSALCLWLWLLLLGLVLSCLVPPGVEVKLVRHRLARSLAVLTQDVLVMPVRHLLFLFIRIVLSKNFISGCGHIVPPARNGSCLGFRLGLSSVSSSGPRSTNTG